ncbi:MAG: hypothetical protein K2N51_18930 [Lachnospiraceae bacterium]|nr:hypothetical protein [Lachnospiraceae bacterium]
MKCNCPYAKDGFGQWCDKVGGKNNMFGYCEDAYPKIIKPEKHSKQKRRNKRERDLKYKKHLKFLAENVQSCLSPAMYTNRIFINGQFVKNPKPYYKRLYRGRGKGASWYYKKLSNKKIRRYKGDILKGNYCHKLYDFWWQLYEAIE